MNTGIWLDKNNAFIVKINGNKEELKKISSKLDFYKIWGGSGTRLKGGPQDVIQDSKYLEKEKNKLRNYFKIIADEVHETDELLIFGPGQTPQQFYKNIATTKKELFSRVMSVEKENSMTQNQIKAYVRNFFNKKGIKREI